MTTVLECGVRKAVKMPTSAAKLRKYAPMKIIRWVISIPKKSIMNPTMNRIIPNISRLSVRAFQILLSSKTGHA